MKVKTVEEYGRVMEKIRTVSEYTRLITNNLELHEKYRGSLKRNDPIRIKINNLQEARMKIVLSGYRKVLEDCYELPASSENSKTFTQ